MTSFQNNCKCNRYWKFFDAESLLLYLLRVKLIVFIAAANSFLLSVKTGAKDM